MSDTNSWIVVTAVAAITLQLLRLSIDLVQVASLPATSGDSGSTQGGRGMHGGGGGGGSASRYGSMEDTTTASSKQGKEESKDEAATEEGQPLLSDSTTTEEDRNRSGRRALRIHSFFVLWVLLTVLFALAAFQAKVGFPIQLLLASAAVLLLECLLLMRDSDKKRSMRFKRFLQLWTALLLWLEYVSLFYGHSAFWTWENATVLAAATLHLALVVWDGWMLAPTPPASETTTPETTEAKKTLSSKAISALLKPYFWPDATDATATMNRVRAIATWFCVISSKTCNLISPLFLGWASTALAHQDYFATMRYSAFYALLSWFGSTLKEMQSLVYLKVAQAAYVQLSTTAFRHLHSLSLDWHLRKKMGVVLRSMTRGIAACDTLMKYLFLWLAPALAECLVVCAIFATYFAYLPLAITVFYFVFVYVVWTILVTLWRKKFRKALVKSDNEMEDRFVDSMINFETVKYFTAESYEAQRFSEAVQRYQTGSVHVQASLSFLNISQQVILKVCLATALSLCALGIQQRADCCIETMGCDSAISECCRNVSNGVCPGMQVGDFVAVLTYTLNLFAPLNFLGSVYNAVVMAIIDLTSMSELLAESPDVADAPDAIELPRKIANDDVAVEFDNVRFHYPTQSENSGLKGLSFKMKRGTTTAIVGPTGAGKTTVGRLLFRFYDTIGGAVLVNGRDTRAVTLESLRSQIGVVPQAASLFNDTLRSNLLYGRRDATEEELRQAAEDSQLISFIESLEDGWETMVGDRGLKLSGGEKQRAAICRCLLKNPPIVLLDEATSALDTLTENSVQEALDRLGADRTVLVIAHRLGTIRKADNIVVLKDGMAAEQGTHDELLALGGVYADMWNMQLHSTSGSNSRTNLNTQQ